MIGAQFTVPPFPQNGTGGLIGATVNVGAGVSMRLIADPSDWDKTQQGIALGNRVRRRVRTGAISLRTGAPLRRASFRLRRRRLRKRRSRHSCSNRLNERARQNRGASSARLNFRHECVQQLQEHIRQLREAVPDAAASWTRVENIHLTLKFFGNVDVDRIPAISAAASRAVKEFSPFQIGIGGTGVFPKPSRAQVLWIGVSDPSGKLVELCNERLENECAAEGFEKEDRAYRPHLTIARLRKPEGARQLADAHLQMKFEPAEIER